MAAGSISFTQNLRKRYYTAYRPIILQTFINDSDVAFVRGQLFVQTYPGGSFVSTGVLINAYEEPSTPNRYSMNIMEYCRSYISTGYCPLFSWNGFMLNPSQTESARFYVKCWPVRYSNTAIGQLVDDYDNEIDSNEAVVIGANTDESTHFSFGDLDKYVLGKNGSYPTKHPAQPLTNMPFLFSGGWVGLNTKITDSNKMGWGNGIDMQDHFAPSFYYLNGVDKPDDNMCIVLVKDLNGVISNLAIFQVAYSPNSAIDMQRVSMHPIALENFISMHTGSSFNHIIDTNGDLISSGVLISMYNTTSSGGGNTNYWGTYDPDGGNPLPRWQGVNYSDYRNGLGSCNLDDRVRVHWKNSLGGYDWFNFYGTISKSVKVSGTRYDKFNHHAIRGVAGKTELWTKREDEFTVISQPLNEITAKWIEELIVSPQVWLEIEMKEAPVRYKSQIVSVNIVPGSYQTFNSEDNMHFIELKYTLANERTQQRG